MLEVRPHRVYASRMAARLCRTYSIDDLACGRQRFTQEQLSLGQVTQFDQMVEGFQSVAYFQSLYNAVDSAFYAPVTDVVDSLAAYLKPERLLRYGISRRIQSVWHDLLKIILARHDIHGVITSAVLRSGTAVAQENSISGFDVLQ